MLEIMENSTFFSRHLKTFKVSPTPFKKAYNKQFKGNKQLKFLLGNLILKVTFEAWANPHTKIYLIMALYSELWKIYVL